MKERYFSLLIVSKEYFLLFQKYSHKDINANAIFDDHRKGKNIYIKRITDLALPPSPTILYSAKTQVLGKYAAKTFTYLINNGDH